LTKLVWLQAECPLFLDAFFDVLTIFETEELVVVLDNMVATSYDARFDTLGDFWFYV